MRKNLTLACSALLIAAPVYAFAQSTDAGMDNTPSSMPSAQEPKTPAIGTSHNDSYEGRSAAHESDPSMPNTDGLHPSGAELNNPK